MARKKPKKIVTVERLDRNISELLELVKVGTFRVPSLKTYDEFKQFEDETNVLKDKLATLSDEISSVLDSEIKLAENECLADILRNGSLEDIKRWKERAEGKAQDFVESQTTDFNDLQQPTNTQESNPSYGV